MKNIVAISIGLSLVFGLFELFSCTKKPNVSLKKIDERDKFMGEYFFYLNHSISYFEPDPAFVNKPGVICAIRTVYEERKYTAKGRIAKSDSVNQMLIYWRHDSLNAFSEYNPTMVRLSDGNFELESNIYNFNISDDSVRFMVKEKFHDYNNCMVNGIKIK
jgi:hypothetical protein